MDYSTYEHLVAGLYCFAVPILALASAVALDFGSPSRRAWIVYISCVSVLAIIMNNSTALWMRYAPNRVADLNDLSAGVGIVLVVKTGVFVTACVGITAALLGFIRELERRRERSR